MGGNGTIGGGGSCKAKFFVYDNQGGQKDHWDCHDTDVSYPYDVRVQFPGGAAVLTTISGPSQKIKIDWPWPNKAKDKRFGEKKKKARKGGGKRR